MVRKFKKTENFEISLEIKNEKFIRPPRDLQRNALLNDVLSEFENDLNALDKIAGRFLSGKPREVFLNDRTQQVLADADIMEDWQIPVMRAMAEAAAESHGDILEIGFGHGVSSTMVQEQKVRSHTIIECNDSVVARFYKWKENFENADIRLVQGLWQETIDDLNLYDGIFFHTYPLNEDEYMEYVHESVTFAEHFFETAAKHLRKDGVFTYFSSEIDSLSRGHQRALFKYFSSVSLSVVGLDIPEDVEDAWWADSIVIVRAIK